MSVQRAEVHWARYLDGNRRVVLEADHARIVAEAGAAVFAFHPEWTVTGMCDPDCLACRRLTELITERSAGYEEGKADAEQEHAAALAGRNAETPIRGEHDPLCFPAIRDVRMGDWGPSCFTCQVIGMARAAAPRTLTADEWEAIAKQFRMAYQLGSCDPSNCPACDCNMDDEGRAQLAGMALQQAQAVIRIIHDGEATPQVKPCSTCGEPVAYLTARPGWAGGWLHHPSRPLDGHPAAIDGEATT